MNLKKLTILGRFFYYTKTAKFYKDGDTYAMIWNFKNPLTYAFAPSFIFLYTLLLFVIEGSSGFDEYYLEDCGLQYKKYFRENPEKIIFVS